MAEYDNRVRSTATGAGAVAIDEGLRAYMLRVYNYMGVGLVLTGLAAFAAYTAAITATPTPYAVGAGQYLTDFGHELMLLQIWADEDRTPPWAGELELRDAETGAGMKLDFDEAARERANACQPNSPVASAARPPTTSQIRRWRNGCQRFSPIALLLRGIARRKRRLMPR